MNRLLSRFNVREMGLDGFLLLVLLALASIGLVMMTSAAIEFSDANFNSPFFHLKRQLFFLAIAVVSAIIVFNVPLAIWEKYGWLMLFVGMGLLVLVAVPGVGREVNGSRRWLPLGVINLQSSEVAKLCILVYVAGYLVRRHEEVRGSWWGLAKPVLVLGAMVALLLAEPDFGAAVVMSVACLGMIFISGVGLRQFFGLVLTCLVAAAVMVVSSPYRYQRLMCFVDPWEYDKVYNCSYQLTQALIAFGRGEWFGTGLGNSVQKLFFLPESHTDFVFAILAEELGLFGGLIVIALFVVLIGRILQIGRRSEVQGQFFAAYLAYGVGILFAAQVFINIGVNSGLLPTKGLTLPFLSYGGSSLIISFCLVALILRIEFERNQHHACSKRGKKNAASKGGIREVSYPAREVIHDS